MEEARNKRKKKNRMQRDLSKVMKHRDINGERYRAAIRKRIKKSQIQMSKKTA